jgi:pimeloyl-ACP methyl ester carboxylesterase
VPPLLRRILLRVFRIAAAVYILLCVIVYFTQGWLLFPGASSQGTPDATIAAPPGCKLLQLTAATGDRITALYGPALLPDGNVDPDAEHRPTFIYFYGNGATLAWSTTEFNLFRNLGANVLIPDYSGYGMSTGKPTEKSLYATADAAYDYLTNQAHVKPAQIIAAGWSLGAAVAIDLASRRPVAALAVFNPFTSLPDMAAKVFPWLPVRLLVSYRFDNQKNIARISRPTFICNGLLDDLVPPQMSDRLAAAAAGPVTRVKIPDADHNTVFTADPDRVAQGLRRFLTQIGQGSG